MSPLTIMSLAELDEATVEAIARACNLPVSRIEDIFSCTPLQLSMIAETRSEVIHFILSVRPGVDIDRACEAVQEVVSLNPILRTRIVDVDTLGVVQVVTTEEHVTERRSGDIEEYLRDDDAHRLGLGGPLFRSVFIGNAVLVLTLHHTVMDYWSVTEILNVDLPSAYMGRPVTTRPAFKEFVSHCMRIDESAARASWASRFKGVPAIFPAVKPGHSPQVVEKPVRKITLRRIANGGVPHTHIPYYIEAAWALTASIYADSESVAYGYVLSGRSSGVDSSENTLGPTIAEVPVQVNIQRTMTVERLIKDRATSLRQLQTHPALHYGISKIAQASEAAKAAAGFQMLHNIRPIVPTNSEEGDVTLERMVWLRGYFPLQLIFNILDDGVMVEPRSDPAVICDRQLCRVLNQFQHMLELLTESSLQTKLESLPLLNLHDSSEVFTWNRSIPEAATRCIHEVFSAQARAHPTAMAVEACDGSVSYAELDQLSDHLAQELQRRGVSRGNTVAFIFEKSLWAIVAILGIMKSGGACVPIDKNDEYDRKAAIISWASAKIVLTSASQYDSSTGLAPDVFALAELAEVTDRLDNSVASSAQDPAYIAMTSGVTGAPKGVLLNHCNLVSSLTSKAERLSWGPGCRMLQFASYVSSNSILEILGTLLFGGCLCIPPEETQESDLPSFIESARINWALLTPTTLRTFQPNSVSGLQTVLSIGEPVDTETSKIWAGALRLFNGWGACEASILSTVTELSPNSDQPGSIGLPVGCAVWIVNRQNNSELAPIGSVGRLWIEGPGVASGYLNDEAKLSASFITSPAWASPSGRTGSRFYRTGDLAKYNPDGSISFIGREVNRVKLGGQVIQLEEVESVLSSCDKVRDIITATKISAGRTQLVAVVSLADPQLPRTSVLEKLPDSYAEAADQQLKSVQSFAESMLPLGKIPSIWLIVQKLPRTASEKLDRAAIRTWLKGAR